MSAKGGYLILDLKNKPLNAETGTVIPGAYETLEGNYGKPVMCCGFNYNNEAEIGAQYVPVRIEESNYLFTIGKYIVIIDSDDRVFAVETNLPVGGYEAGDGITIEDGVISLSE